MILLSKEGVNKPALESVYTPVAIRALQEGRVQDEKNNN